MSAFRSQVERVVWAAKFAQFSADSEFHQRIACVAVLALRGESPSSDIIDDLAAAMLAEMRGGGESEQRLREGYMVEGAQAMESENARLREALDAYGAPPGETEHDRLRAWEQRERRLRAALEAVAWFEAPGLNGARWCCRGCGGETRTRSTDACTPDCIVGQALGSLR